MPIIFPLGNLCTIEALANSFGDCILLCETRPGQTVQIMRDSISLMLYFEISLFGILSYHTLYVLPHTMHYCALMVHVKLFNLPTIPVAMYPHNGRYPCVTNEYLLMNFYADLNSPPFHKYFVNNDFLFHIYLCF